MATTEVNSAAVIGETEESGQLVNLWATKQKSDSVCGQIDKMLSQSVVNKRKCWVSLWATRQNVHSVCGQLDKMLSQFVAN